MPRSPNLHNRALDSRPPPENPSSEVVARTSGLAMQTRVRTGSAKSAALLSGRSGDLPLQGNGPFRARSAERVNILLVDDRDDKLLAYQTALECLGQNVVCARSGREALQRLMEKDFAVVVLDVFMPTMDGIETAALIRQQ